MFALRLPDATVAVRLVAGLTLILVGGAAPGQARVPAEELADLTLEQLGNVVVTSVSRRPQSVASAAASVFVISRDDIRRSGATSLPEALRLAPNLQVARADANQYGITARGSNSVLANKMLVMIDGRTVYSPIFSGVFWEAVDVLLEDIERIEVISGPGATLWGINAVNGVINVITRSALATKGAFVEAGGGNRERGGGGRYGGAAGGNGAFRVYAKSFERDASVLRDGQPVRDASDRGQIGFRYDEVGPSRSFTLQGDAYRGRIDQVPSSRDISGANLLTRWAAPLSSDSEVMVQAYYDHTYRLHPGTFEQSLDTIDALVQYRTRVWSAHDVIVGAGYRYARDRVETPGPALAFLPGRKTLSWSHVFAQDEIALRPDLRLTAGAKVESNVYTGAEFLPNLRLAWQPQEHRLLWSAISRAVRAPARFDRDLYQPAQPPHFLLNGGPDFESEVAKAVEVGYREQQGERLYWSATLFYNDFDRLRSIEPRPGGPRTENRIEGRVYGMEAWAEWRVTAAWRLSAGGVRQRVEFERDGGSRDVAGLAALSFDPAGWWSVRSSLDLPANLALDAAIRRVGGFVRSPVAGYTAFDVRLGWQPRPSLELSLTLQNAFDPGHAEWGPPSNPAEHPRTAFVRAVWRQ